MNFSVILADIDSELIASLASSLLHLGHRPVRVFDGSELVRRCRLEPPDLAIVNLNLAGMGGLEAVELIRLETDVPIILMSEAW